MRGILPLGLVMVVVAAAEAQTAPSAAEQVTQAEGHVARIRQMQTRLFRLVAQARRKKDIVQLNCVNDKLQQLRGNLGVAEQSLAALRLPATQADEGARNHEFAKVTLTHQKALSLAQEAETCVGEEQHYAGSTRVEVDVDPNVPQQDPTLPPEEEPQLERAPAASPFI
jgi:hypothetical protein